MIVLIYYLGLDWITYKFFGEYEGAFFDSLFRDFSETANQHFGVKFFGHDFDVSYFETRAKQVLLFTYIGTTVFELVKNRNSNSAARQYSYKFTFYGAYFYIEDLSDILLKFTKQYARHMRIYRLDIALDCNVPILSLYNNKHTQFVKEQLFKKYGILTGFYLGRRKGNDKYFLRIYDKKLDSNEKGKFHLFSRYFVEEVVSRIEIELHALTLDGIPITPQTIIEYEEARMTGFVSTKNRMEQYFASFCMNKGGTDFYDLKDVNFKDIKRITIASFTGKTEEIVDKMRYVKDFIGRAKTLKKMKIEPIPLLERHLKPPPVIGSK